MSRYCANCGTEVDDTAIFCPTCGQPIDQDVETAIPPAPAWPDATEAASARQDAPAPRREEPPAEPTRPWSDEPAASPSAQARPDPRDSEFRPVSERRIEPAGQRPPDAVAPHAEPSGARPPAPARPDEPRATAEDRPAQPSESPLANLPLTMPVTLSGWLIGIGAAIGAIGALISLFDGFGAAVDLLLLVALAAVALTVFLADRIPSFAHLRMTTFAIVLVAFGAGLDRLLTGARGVGELLLFLGTAAAVIGAIILELGRDQPLGGPS